MKRNGKRALATGVMIAVSLLASVAAAQGIQESKTDDGYGYSFDDALIVAAALGAGCTRLLSEDMQDGHRIEGLTIANPFSA